MNKLFRILIIGALFGSLLVLTWTFFTAFNNPSKTVLIDINYYHEAWIEAILMPLLVCLGSYLLYDELKGVKNEIH